MTDSWALRLEEVRRVFAGTRRTGPRTAVDRLSLSFDPGGWTALLGPNGSGKSTLLRMIATLDEPTEGRVRWFGDSATTPAARRARIGVVLQTTSLDPLLTGRENLRLHGAVFGMPRDEVQDRIHEVAADVGVSDRLDDRVGALSGGLRRRLDLARALLPTPELLLLDEATVGLDPPSRADFLRCVQRHRSERDMTVIMSTHLMDEAERADRVIMMDRGHVVADGTPEALRNSLSNNALLVSAPSQAAATLLECGLNVHERNGEVVATIAEGKNQQLAQIVAALAGHGFSVRVGATTLEDVFVAKTGRSLDAQDVES